LQIDIINNEIRNAKRGVLHLTNLFIGDSTESIVEAHASVLEWHMQSRKLGMTAIQLEILQQKSIAVTVLESLKSIFPEKNCVANGWKFEKAHSILHKARELILFG
jgi:hypothetical protein